MRDLKSSNSIYQIWNWGWTYHGLSINNWRIGIGLSAGGSNALNVGSVTLFDSTFTNVPVAILTAWTTNSNPAHGRRHYYTRSKPQNEARGLYMENLWLW
ncbi:hypothetical protein VTK26DRAFT_6050 [Humicola hyalothermophila]